MSHVENTSAGGLHKIARKRLLVSASLTFVLFLAEFVGGLMSNSLALLSDAGHMVGDLAALCLSLLSMYWATHRTNPQKTYGYHRAEVLATFANAALLLYVAFQILWEGVHRFQSPVAVQLQIMLPVAVAGMLVNVVCIFLLRHLSDHMVTRSALYHVVSDTFSSLGVILAALFIHLFGWIWMDPLMSGLISLLIIRNALHLLREVYDVLMEASPHDIKLSEVRKVILGVAGVEEVHDLHVWTISSGFLAASAHILVRDMSVRQSDRIVSEISRTLKDLFGITHATVQVAALPAPAKIQKLQTELFKNESP